MKPGPKQGKPHRGRKFQMVDIARMLGVSERSVYGNYRKIADEVLAGRIRVVDGRVQSCIPTVTAVATRTRRPNHYPGPIAADTPIHQPQHVSHSPVRVDRRD
jgi:hypothetical protein